MRLCDCWQELPKRHDRILRLLREAGLEHRGLSADALRPDGDRSPKQHVRTLKDLASRKLIEAVWPEGNPYGEFVLTRDGWGCFGEERPARDYYETKGEPVYFRIV